MYQAGRLTGIQMHSYVYLFSWFSNALNKKKNSFAEVGSLGRLVSWFSSSGKTDSFTLEICAVNFFHLLFNCINRSLLFYSLPPAFGFSTHLGSMHALPKKLNTTSSESRVRVSHNTSIPVNVTKCPGVPLWVLPCIDPLSFTRNKYSKTTLWFIWRLYVVCYAHRWNRELFLHREGLLTTKRDILQQDSARTQVLSAPAKLLTSVKVGNTELIPSARIWLYQYFFK